MGNPVNSAGMTNPVSAGHPSGDERFGYLDTAMKRHRHRPDSLIEILHTAQELFGFLEDDVLRYVSRGLRLPPSRVYGVASFYHLFTFSPKGKHSCSICTGTACHVKGADELLTLIEQMTGVHAGRTAEDGSISVETARCIGACGLAPIVIFDGDVIGHLTTDQVAERVKGWIDHGPR